MRRLWLIGLALSGCAPTTPAAIYRTPVELTIASAKAPRDFAMCVAAAFPNAGQMFNEGDHYWVIRNHGGVAYERWDFLPTPTGSVGERRSGQLVKEGAGRVRGCA